MSDTDIKPSKVKTGVIIVVTLIIGIMIGSSGNGSTTSSTSIKQSSSGSIETATESPKPLGKVEVKSHNQRMDIGYAKVVGEVVNNTGRNVESVKVTATFYDKDNAVIATNFTYVGETTSTPLEPELTAPFEVSSYPAKINPDHYKLDVTWR